MLMFLALFIWSAALGHDVSPFSMASSGSARAKMHLSSFANLQDTVKATRSRGFQDETPRGKRQSNTAPPPPPPPPPSPPPLPDTCSKPREEPLPYRLDTAHTTHKHEFTYNDVSTKASSSPTRFSDMGYLLYGYDIYKGNPLTFGFDPGFRHPLFDHGDIADYLTTVDGRHTHPPGTTALSSHVCSATFRQTVIQTLEDLQARQGSVSEEGAGFSFDGAELVDALPESVTQKNPKTAALAEAAKTLKASHSSMNNDEYRAEMSSASREDSTTIVAEASCSVYQAKLNLAAPPPLLPEVKAWILKMIETQKRGGGNKEELRAEIMDFIGHYGTHILTGISFGARYMYNFTLAAQNEGEITDTFDSFQKAVNTELKFLGLGFGSNKQKSQENAESTKRNQFEENVEVNVKSIGAPLPETKEDGITPDSTEWAKHVFENPVPIKISHVGIENIFGAAILGKDFIEENACKRVTVTEKELSDLKKEFVRVLPKKAVTACERRIKHCETKRLTGQERTTRKNAINLESREKHLITLKETLKDSPDQKETAEELFREQNNLVTYQFVLAVFGENLPAKCRKKIEDLATMENPSFKLKGSISAYLDNECFKKIECYWERKHTVCTKIVGYTNSYAAILSKRGGLPEENLVLVEEGEEEEEANSLYKKIKDLMEAGIEELSKEIPFCREYETGKKEEPKGCDSSKVEEGFQKQKTKTV